MKIYQNEENDNLAEKLKNQATIAFSSIAKKVEPSKSLMKLIANQDFFGANPNQADLFYLESILASVGWNKNDDVFSSDFVWGAKDTPVDKPFNFMHNEADIIGHITSSRVVDKEANIVDDYSNLPSEFDIVTGSVIYKIWQDEDRQEKIDKLIAEIEEGKWYVSMECLFTDFDYAIITPDGLNKVVARNEESSYLTKHLRAYGGKGEYDGFKLGRLIKAGVFSGKGLVEKPANPESIIISGKSTNKVFASAENVELKTLTEKTLMSDTNTVSVEQFKALEAKLEKAESAAQEVVQKEVDSLKTSNKTLAEEKTSVQDELKNVKALSEEKDEKITKLEASLKESSDKLEALEKEIAEQKAEAVKKDRVNQLVSVGLESEKSLELVEKFVTASDEMFSELVSLQKDKVEAAKDKDMKDKKDKKDDVDNKDKKDKKDDKVKADVDVADLDSADDVTDASLSTAGEDKGDLEVLRTSASQWLANSLTTTKKDN